MYRDKADVVMDACISAMVVVLVILIAIMLAWLIANIIEALSRKKTIIAKVAAVAREGDNYFFLLENYPQDKEFKAPSSLSPALKWAKPGDSIAIEVLAKEKENIIRIFDFEKNPPQSQ